MAELTINGTPHAFVLGYSALKLMATRYNKTASKIADDVAAMDVVTIGELMQVGLSRGASANGLNPQAYTVEFVENALDAQPELLGIITLEYSAQVGAMYAAVNDWAEKNAKATAKVAK